MSDELLLIQQAMWRYHHDAELHAEVEQAISIARTDPHFSAYAKGGAHGVADFIREAVSLALYLRDEKSPSECEHEGIAQVNTDDVQGRWCTKCGKILPMKEQ